MPELSIEAQPRELTGKKVRRLRRAGLLPAVVYGPTVTAPRSIQVDRKTFESVYRSAGKTRLIDLALAGGATTQVLIKDVQYNLLKRQIEHVDFYAADLQTETMVAVPIVLEGSAPVAERGEGVVNQVLMTVNVRALPTRIPAHVTVDVSRLETLNDDVRVGDLRVPPGVTVVDDLDTVVVSVTVSAAQLAAAEEAAERAAEAAAEGVPAEEAPVAEAPETEAPETEAEEEA